jgi:hypothetical protein
MMCKIFQEEKSEERRGMPVSNQRWLAGRMNGAPTELLPSKYPKFSESASMTPILE